MRSGLLLATLLLLACGDDDDDHVPPPDAGQDAALPPADAATDAALPVCLPAHVDDEALPDPPACPAALADGARDLLAEARATAGLDGPLVWSAADLDHADYGPVLGDQYVLPGYAQTHDAPETAVCFANDVSRRLDHAAASGHALSGSIAEAASRLGLELDVSTEPSVDPALCSAPLATAALAFARAVGGTPDEAAVIEDAADVPLTLQGALAPILLAMVRVAEARAAAVAMFGQIHGEDVALNTPDLAGIGSRAAVAWIPSRILQDELVAAWRTDLAQAARDLAVAIDHARPVLTAGGFGTGFEFALDTPAGKLLVEDGADDTYEADLDPIALLVDSGGDDVYRCAAGATTFPTGELLTIPVSVLVDAGGADRYGYEEFPSEFDGVGHRVPADSWGRAGAGPGPYCVAGPNGQSYGPVTLSRDVRQGAGVFGVGILADWAGATTRTRRSGAARATARPAWGSCSTTAATTRSPPSPRRRAPRSWAWGSWSTWAARTRTSPTRRARASGTSAASGRSWTWVATTPTSATAASRPRAETPCTARRSARRATRTPACARARGSGCAATPTTRRRSWAVASASCATPRATTATRPRCSRRARATGRGFGLLSDGGGDDAYDSIRYVQGAAAHYAVGMLVDAGGDDVYDDREWTVGVALGSGHDFSVGLLVDESGDDCYFGAGNGLGDGNCNGIGLLVDNGGSDTWRSTTLESLGHAHASGECVRRGDVLTGALFVDAAGVDTYERPAGEPVAGDDRTFPANAGNAGEHGAFVDASGGDSRVHALPAR